MTKKNAEDIILLAQSFSRNKRILIESLMKEGYPVGWLSSWQAKLDRLAKAAQGSAKAKGGA